MIPRDPVAIVAESPDMTLSREIAELRELKAAMEAGRRAFFARLRECEERGGWRALAATFGQFLKRTELCAAAEYDAACRTLDIVPPEAIDVIGMTAATKLVELPEESRPAALADLTKAAEKTGPLLARGANSVLQRHRPPPPPSPPPPRQTDSQSARPGSESPRPAGGTRMTVGAASIAHEPLPEPPPLGFDLRVPTWEPSAIAGALIARLGEETCRALILALDAKVNRV